MLKYEITGLIIFHSRSTKREILASYRQIVKIAAEVLCDQLIMKAAISDDRNNTIVLQEKEFNFPE